MEGTIMAYPTHVPIPRNVAFAFPQSTMDPLLPANRAIIRTTKIRIHSINFSIPRTVLKKVVLQPIPIFSLTNYILLIFISLHYI